MVRRAALLAIALLVTVSAHLEAQFVGETIARGFRSPVLVVADPTNGSVLLVVEQGGLVRVVRNGIVLEQPFLDLTPDISTGGERGLLGLALSPDFADSRRFFVNFTDTNGDTVIARFVRHADNPLIAERSSRFDLVWPDGRRVIPQPFANHNGGHLAFGPDGYLYIGMGDGGSGGDPMNHAQNPQSLLGKMLRLDVNVPDEDTRGYRVPEDNPFIDGEPIRALPEIWAFGVRNPWRFSFDDWTRGGTAALVMGDVGQNAREEINFEPRTASGSHRPRNYGWRLREGRQSYDTRTPAAFQPLSEPMHDYGRAVGGSITGGYIYRGAQLDPRFNGRYFFADFISGRVFSIGVHVNGETGEAAADDEQEHTERLGGRSTLGMVSSFGVDHDGELLVVNYSNGTLVRVSPDLSTVPAAPILTAEFRDTRVRLIWAAAGSVSSDAFQVERLRQGAVVEQRVVQRPEDELDAPAGDCFRVRSLNRTGQGGPPSQAACTP